MSSHLLPGRRSAAFLGLVLGFLLSGAQAGAQTPTPETEPNSSCAAPQNLALPAIVGGSLDTPPDLPDVDFFQLSATPGALVTIDLEGANTAQGTLSDPYVGVFEPGCLAFIAVNDDGGAGTNSRVTFTVPAGGTFVVAASAYPDFDFSGVGYSSGSYRLSVREQAFAEALTGRVVHSGTGAPVFQASVALQRCDGDICEFAGSAVTDGSGGFRFDPSNLHGYLLAGEYRLDIQANGFEPAAIGPFQVLGGGVENLGDLALRPVPTVNQIRGRVIDAQTGAPLAGTTVPFAGVELVWCDPTWFYCYGVRFGQVDANGNFRFDGNAAAPLAPGEYQLRILAEQYQPFESERFTVAADAIHDTGAIGLKSFPVRVNLVQACNTIPAAGGTCRYTVQIANGLSERLDANSWGIVQVYGTGTPAESTTFQVSNSKVANLAPGETTNVPFSFNVPGTVASGASICIRGFVAEHPSPFDTVGSHDLFCLTKGDTAFAVVPQAQKRDALKKAKGQ